MLQASLTRSGCLVDAHLETFELQKSVQAAIAPP
jgi:hypothetical protein